MASKTSTRASRRVELLSITQCNVATPLHLSALGRYGGLSDGGSEGLNGAGGGIDRLQDAELVDSNSARCQRADLENIFISTNMLLGVNPYQARGTQTHAQLLAAHDRLSIAREYDMRGFLRFQFIAALVQTAINKFILSERASSSSRGRSAAAAGGGTTTPKKREKPQTVRARTVAFSVHSHAFVGRGSLRRQSGLLR